MHFRLRLYRKDAASAPVPEDGGWYDEELVRFGGSGGKEAEAITIVIAPQPFQESRTDIIPLAHTAARDCIIPPALAPA